MPKVLNSITLNAPAAPVSANVSDTFAFSGTPGFSGSGGVNRYDFRWEVNGGGGYVPIAASGSGLITAGTNPVVNSNSATQQSITVTCGAAGTYTVRMTGAPATGGSYTVVSSTQTVNVAAGPELHNGAFTATGGGVASPVAAKGAQVGITGTGGGTTTQGESTDRQLAVTSTGGGVIAWGYEVASGDTDLEGDFTATGGGVLTIGTSSAHDTSFTAAGGGAVVIATSADRQFGFQATGGGAASLSASSARIGAALMTGGGALATEADTQRFVGLIATGGGTAEFTGTQAEDHAASFAATGGGVSALAVTTDRLVSLIAVGGGAFVPVNGTERYGAFVATGGGQVVWVGSSSEAPLPGRIFASTATVTTSGPSARVDQ